jgi:hypothetical protein
MWLAQRLAAQPLTVRGGDTALLIFLTMQMQSIFKLLFMQVWKESCWHPLLNIQGLECQLLEWFIVIREDDITMRWCVKKVK